MKILQIVTVFFCFVSITLNILTCKKKSIKNNDAFIIHSIDSILSKNFDANEVKGYIFLHMKNRDSIFYYLGAMQNNIKISNSIAEVLKTLIIKP